MLYSRCFAKFRDLSEVIDRQLWPDGLDVLAEPGWIKTVLDLDIWEFMGFSFLETNLVKYWD